MAIFPPCRSEYQDYPNDADALAAAQNELETTPYPPMALRRVVARLLFANGRVDAAIEVQQEIASRHPLPSDLVPLAEYQRYRGNWEDAERTLGRATRQARALAEFYSITETEWLAIGRLNRLRSRMGPNDDLFLFLIGHGTYRQSARFNIEGPDLLASDLAGALARWPSRITVVNTASTSAPFIQALAGPNRVITTKGVDENNATRFAEYFIQGLEELIADRIQGPHPLEVGR